MIAAVVNIHALSGNPVDSHGQVFGSVLFSSILPVLQIEHGPAEPARLLLMIFCPQIFSVYLSAWGFGLFDQCFKIRR